MPENLESSRDLEVVDPASPPTHPRKLSDRYDVEDGSIYLTGVQALVRLPLDIRRMDERAGLNTAVFVSGYEGSPLAGYDLELIRQRKLLDKYGVVHQPGLNEELAANAVQGTQLAPGLKSANKEGVVGLWYGKAPGLDRATDALRHSALGGTHPKGGAVALVGDDAIAKSSTVPSGSEIAMAEMGMTVLSPSDSQDILDLGLHAVALSRFTGLWTGLKIATNVADGAGSAQVSPDRIKVVVPDNTFDGVPYVHEPTARLLPPYLQRLEETQLGERLELARRYGEANGLNKRQGSVNAKIGIVTHGIAYLDVMEGLAQLGIGEAELDKYGIAILKLGMVHPLIPAEIDDFTRGLDEVIVVEEKRNFVESAIKDLLYNVDDAPTVVGKFDDQRRPLLRSNHDLGADLIAMALAKRLSTRLDIPSVNEFLAAKLSPPVESPSTRKLLPLIPRTPYFCSGCPHNRSTVVPAGSTVGAGIGCHAMALFLDEDRVGDLLGTAQMGGEGAPWIGIEPFVDDKHLFQNIGDGTFHHSGSLAVRATVAAGVNVTYKLLYNSAVAMTGGQEAVGGMTVPELCQMLLAEGVKKIVVTTEDLADYRGVKLPKGVDVRHRDKLIETQEELAAIPGVTVLIHDQECATELRRKRKRKIVEEPPERIFINQRVCEGCGDCGDKSNCLSVQPVETEFGRKTQIHQPSCNKDYSCLDGDCPSFISIIPGVQAKEHKIVAPPIEASELPDPQVNVPEEEFSIRFLGIGGTGIVTVSAIVAQAGIIAGRHVRTLDQLGLAQKGGAVISDIKIGAEPIDAANKISKGACDLYIVCDLLVGATDGNLEITSPDKTIAVINKAHTPTGAMVADTGVLFPGDDATVGKINDATRAANNTVVDARLATLGLFGDDQFANVFMVGVAFQAGALPIPADAIEEAIRLNGVAVDMNIQAFRRGRQLVSDRVAINEAVDALGLDHLRPAKAEEFTPSNAAVALVRKLGGAPDSELRRLVTLRASELEAYQNKAYAKEYVEYVEKVRAAEEQFGSEELAENVARYLFKLMAYKDEYEVARLSLDAKLAHDIKATFGDDASYSFRLHPPMLRALGMDSKISIPAGVGHKAFQALYAMRRLRGTKLDPFGMAHVRRVERELIGQYRTEIDAVLRDLRAGNHPVAVQIAALPDIIRGYEEIKLGNVEKYREQLAAMKKNFAATGTPVTAD